MAEPITVAQVEGQIRFDLIDEIDTIVLFISAIRQSCESATRRALITKQKVMKLAKFPGIDPIEIPDPPLRSIDSIVYIDIDGVEQTLTEDTDFRVILSTDDPVQPSVIAPLYNEQWPTARTDYDSVKITYTCGYGLIDTVDIPVPEALIQWMLINIANLYEHRESIQVDSRLMMIEIPTLADMLLTDYRIAGW